MNSYYQEKVNDRGMQANTSKPRTNQMWMKYLKFEVNQYSAVESFKTVRREQ